MSSQLTRRFSTGISVLVLAVGVLVVPASAAGAAERDGACDSGEVCFYYNSNQQGAVSDFSSSVGSYGESQPKCYEFKGSGKGAGECMKNQAASVANRSDKPVTVYYNSNYQGASQTIPAGESANLGPELKNQNASHLIGDTGSSGGASSLMSDQSSGSGGPDKSLPRCDGRQRRLHASCAVAQGQDLPAVPGDPVQHL